MFGFLIGIASLIGLIAVLRSGRRCGARGWHGGWHGGGHRHGHHDHHGHHHGGGSRGWLRWLFQRLDTTPGQEKEIARAIDELMEQGARIRKEAQTSRDDVARAMRAESLDETQLGELFARHDDTLREMQKAFAGALGRIHTVLEPDQRAKLAELIESGPRFGFGPYRGWA
jgi:Spy/CpxP family protein refolding chaperone